MGSDRVRSDLCIGEKRPRNTKKCEEKSCLKYMWKVGNWSEVCLSLAKHANNKLLFLFFFEKKKALAIHDCLAC